MLFFVPVCTNTITGWYIEKYFIIVNICISNLALKNETFLTNDIELRKEKEKVNKSNTIIILVQF